MTEPTKPVEPQEPTPKEPVVEEPKYTQKELDAIAANARKLVESQKAEQEKLKQQLAEYDNLKKQQETQDLERKQEYDKIKEAWSAKENEYKSLLSERDNAINSERVGNALTMEILKQNAYPDAVDLLRSKAVYEDGIVKIKGKDANGMENLLPIEEGVKQFLNDKPYLQKVAGGGGSGTAPANAGSTSAGTRNLAQELQDAMRSGDRKKVVEVKQLIKAKHSQLEIA